MSSNLKSLRFMQRGQEKKNRQEIARMNTEKRSNDMWVLPGAEAYINSGKAPVSSTSIASVGGASVLADVHRPVGKVGSGEARLSRRSFGSFNSKVEENYEKALQEAKLGPVDDDLPADGMLESFGDKLTAKAERIREKRARKEARRKAREGQQKPSTTSHTTTTTTTATANEKDTKRQSSLPPSQRVDSFLAQFAGAKKRERKNDKGRKDKKKKHS